MTYTKLGCTDLNVSSICLGTMTFGDGADAIECRNLYAACRDSGVNFFDCANVYADGESERILGQLVKDHRGEVVITSKAFYPIKGEPGRGGLSREHLTEALHRSLVNMDTDYIDIYYFHNFDYDTPLEESLAAVTKFAREGKIRAVGLSNFAAWQVMKAIGITARFEFAPIACIQPMYSLLKRQCESELLPMARNEKLGVVSYSPLAGGYLTGKYLGETTGQCRFDTSKMYQQRYADEANGRAVEGFLTLASETNIHPVTLAIAWVGSHQDITAPIIGARNVEQLKPSLDSMKVRMNEELRATISTLSSAPPLANDREEERI